MSGSYLLKISREIDVYREKLISTAKLYPPMSNDHSGKMRQNNVKMRQNYMNDMRQNDMRQNYMQQNDMRPNDCDEPMYETFCFCRLLLFCFFSSPAVDLCCRSLLSISAVDLCCRSLLSYLFSNPAV